MFNGTFLAHYSNTFIDNFKKCVSLLKKFAHLQKSFTVYSKINYLNFIQFLSFYIHSSIFDLSTVNPFHATGFFLYPLKTSEDKKYSDSFRIYRERSVV